MEKFKSWVHVRLAFCKNIIPLTWRYFCTYFKSISYHQIILRDVLLLSHALEKGLIYNEPKPNWGIAKANSLFDKIEYLLNNNMTPTSFEIIEGLSVLEIYSIKNKQVQLSNKVLSLRKKYLIFDIYPAGRIEKTSSELFNYNDAESFIRSRRSVRFFTDRLVDENKILQAIDIANSTPSACNRQPCKVYYSIDTDTISEMGNFFLTAYRFETGIPQLLVVTSSLSLFSSDEYLQPLVNGGMYVSYLLLAFHSMGISTTPLEMVSFKAPEKDIRRKLGINDDEVIVSAIAIGYPMETNNLTCGARRSANDIAIKY